MTNSQCQWVTEVILGVEHPDTIRAMANLAATYRELDKHIQAHKLEIQVKAARWNEAKTVSGIFTQGIC